jgi:hypothetical protein
MFANLFSSWSRRSRAARRPIRNGKRGSARRLCLEALEDRLVMSQTKVFAGLEFMTDGTFSTTNHVVTATSPVKVGVNPTGGAAFNPVLSLDGGVRFTDNDATGTFTTTGTVSAVSGSQTLPLLDAHAHTFKAPALLGTSFYALGTGDTNQPDLPVAGGRLAVTGLRMTAAELDVQGAISLPGLTGMTLQVQNNDFVAVDGTGAHLMGPDSSQGLPQTFTKGGLSVTTQNLLVHYVAANNEFDVSGQASVSVADNTLSVTLGSSTAPGLVIVNGDLQSLDASVTSDVKVAGLTFHTEDLAFHYAAADPNITITGKANFTFKDHTLELALGATGSDGTMHPGIAIDKTTGRLVSLDAAVTTDVTVGAVDFMAKDLGIHYAPGDPDVTITGTAAFDLKNTHTMTDQMVAINFGADGHPGIVINKDDGSLVSLDAAVTADITVAGLEIKADSLGVEYVSGSNSFAVFGGASFTLKDQTVGIQLGDRDHPGLVITDGHLDSLTASVTADIHLLGVTLSATNLTVAYMAPMDGNQEAIAIYGEVAVSTSFLHFDSTLGTADCPGIEIVGGELQNLNLTVNGGFSLFGFNVAADGLMIKYPTPTGQLELSGGVMLQFTSSFQVGASITEGGLLIDTHTGALSVDTSHGLHITANAHFGPVAIQHLDIAFSDGPNGINFHASGEVDIPGGIQVSLTTLDIQDGQLANIGLSVSAPIPVGDTGFFIDTLSGELDNLNNPSQLVVHASATVSFGDPIYVPPIPDIFAGGTYYLIGATGSITVSARELDLSGHVTLLGGLLGDGDVAINLNWATGVYTIAVPHIGIYDDVINFGGSFTVTNHGDITLEATGSVNVPPQIPFIGGDSLGNINFYLQYRPGEDWTHSYIAAWTSVNLFFTTATIGFKADFEGNFSVLNGDDVAAIGMAVMTPPQQNQPLYTYSQNVNISDPTASGAEVTLSSPIFDFASYATGAGHDVVASYGEGAGGNTVYTYYQLSNANVILGSLYIYVYAGNTDIGTVTFDANGTFHFASTGTTALAPTGAILSPFGTLTLLWPGYDPGPTSIDASYVTINDIHGNQDVYLELLQQTASGPVPVGRYAIDPIQSPNQGGMLSAAAGATLYKDNLANTAPVQHGGTWTTTYSFNHGPADRSSLSFTLTSGSTFLGTGTFDKVTGAFHFAPNGTPPFMPVSALLNDNTLSLTWTTNPGTTSIAATYRSVIDRVIKIDFTNDVVPGGERGQYVVELVTPSVLDSTSEPMFSESTHYMAPTVQFAAGSPYLSSDGKLHGIVYANSFTPEAAQFGAKGTKVAIYYSTTNSTANGKLIQTLDFGNFINFDPSHPFLLKQGGFIWSDFQNLPAGQYYVYAVITDGQNPPVTSAVAGPFTAASPRPALSGPGFLALTSDGHGHQQGTFSAAAGTALGVTTSFVNPVTVDLSVTGGTLTLPGGGNPAGTFTGLSFPSAAQATAALDGLKFVSDGTFTGAATLTLTVTTNINGTSYQSVESVPLLTPNTHLVVKQSVDAASPADPDTVVLTVTVTNPGGPDGQDGTNVKVQQYLSPGLIIQSFTASQGTFNPATGLWNIGTFWQSANGQVTLTLTLRADPGSYDKQLSSMADGSSDLFNYPAADAQNVIAITPRSHDVVFNPGPLPTTAVHAIFEEQFTADRGGGGPYTFAVTHGSLPPGLFLTSSGSLAGVATTEGDYTFSVTATSQTGVNATTSLQISVAGAPLAVVGTPYSDTLATLNYSYFTVTPGSSLPPGLRLDTDATFTHALLDGTPTTPGLYRFSVRENSDFFGAYVDHPMTLFVDSALTLNPTTLPTATVGGAYRQPFGLAGGTGGYFVIPYGGSLPKGLSVSLDGTLSGTVDPTATPGTYTFRLYAIDGSGESITPTCSLQVNPAISVGPDSLPAATVNNPYSLALTATGGSGSGYTFALTGGTLPAGLTLSASGILSGTVGAAVVPGGYDFTVTTTDSAGASASEVFSLIVEPAVTVTPADLPDGAANIFYSQTLTATGGSGSGYTFAVTGGALPPGLTLAANGTLSGTIAAAASGGYYAFTVTATDSAGDTGSVACSLFVDKVLNVGPASLPDATVGRPYSQKFTATGGSGIYSFAVTGGHLPGGLTLSPAGILAGTVPASTPAGIYSFTVTVTDSIGMTCSGTCSLTVDAVGVTWTGAVSNDWNNPANWSSHAVPGPGNNVTVPSQPTAGRFPILSVDSAVFNLTLLPGAAISLNGHGLTAYGTLTNQGIIYLRGSEAVRLAHGNDTREGTWYVVGDNTGRTLNLPDFGATDFFNLAIADTHTVHDTFRTTADLTVNGTLAVAGGTLTASGGTVTAGSVAVSGGVLNAPTLLNDARNWIVTGGMFNPNGGTVAFTGNGTQTLNSGRQPFFNLAHTGTGTLSLAGNALFVNGNLTNTAGIFQAVNLPVTVAGTTTVTGGTYKSGSAANLFSHGLAVSGGTFTGGTGAVTAGGVTITGGTLTAPTTTLSNSGDWSLGGGTFNANHGTVALTGTNQHVSGNTTFYNLTKTTTGADTLTFQAGSTQTVAGTLTLRGTATRLLALRSSLPGQWWAIDPLGPRAVADVDVQDNHDVGAAITALMSVNSGDNAGWLFH